MLGLIGKKLGMTQVFGKDGSQIGVTVVKAGPCTVVQSKTTASDGYDAVALGFDETKPNRLTKPLLKRLEKNSLKPLRRLREFRTPLAEKFGVGKTLTVGSFKAGDTVDVIGVSKGRGFQGSIKRHGKHGGPASHGSDFHRRTGSIGMRTWPARVFKNTRLPGHMGVRRVTTKNITVVEVRQVDNALLLHGAVPGAKNSTVIIVNRTDGYEQRPELIGTS